MIKIVGIRFKSAGKIYYFDPVDFNIEQDMHVVVVNCKRLGVWESSRWSKRYG